MKRIKNISLLAALLISISGLMQACAPLVVAGATGGAMVIGDRRPIAIQTIDRGLQIEIESAINKKYGDNVHVNVNVYNQKVLVTGEVKTAEIKAQITDDLKSYKNMKSFYNEVQVGPPSSVSSRVADTSTFTMIKTRLVATSDVPSNSMKVVVEDGRVYLLGILTEQEAKAAGVVTSKSSGSIKEVNKYFDIVSQSEAVKLEQPNNGDGATVTPIK